MRMSDAARGGGHDGHPGLQGGEICGCAEHDHGAECVVDEAMQVYAGQGIRRCPRCGCMRGLCALWMSRMRRIGIKLCWGWELELEEFWEVV
jgi:hypothetical protein